MREVISGGAGWSAADTFRAHEALAGLAAQAAATWRAIDALLVPTAPLHPTHEDVAADPIGVNARLGTYTTFANLLDLCAVALPAEPRPDGLPFGVTLLAPAFSDAALLDLAARWPGPEDALVDLVVCGAHMRGLPLNGQLLALGARFVRRDVTASAYRLYALPGGERPGLVRSADGAPIDVEVWRLTAGALGALMRRIPAPLGIGTVELAGSRGAPGFLCEAHAAPGCARHNRARFLAGLPGDAGSRRRGSKPGRMSESHTEPHVSGQELRAALASNGRSRPNPLMTTSEAPAWEWTTDEQAELDELRESTAELETEIERLRSVAHDARAREKEARDAMRRLAAAKPWQRRTVLAELGARGLI